LANGLSSLQRVISKKCGGTMNQTAKKVLVVGGAGYVGSVLVPELLERGYAVKVFDRLYYGDQGLKDVRDRIQLEIGDMRLIPPSVLSDVDAVINLGGLSNDPTAEYNPKANYEMNTVATEKLALLCKQAGIERFVFASSASIYDVGEGNDSRDILLDETAEVDPKAAYSRSKYEAERILLNMADAHFCPVLLRKGTVFGFSPRMRYDLVVNTFVMGALSKGLMTLHFGGEMWRPLVDVRDVAKAYITCLQAPADKVRGQIFNVVHRNYRISELAYRIREGLRQVGVNVEIQANYRYKGVRNYRISGKKMEQVLDFRPTVSVEESVVEMVEKIRAYGYNDFDNPRYYNIRWMKLLEEIDRVIKYTGSVFDWPHEDATPGTVPWKQAA
jgi:nucleoside-diphosphate-sugar epimerase